VVVISDTNILSSFAAGELFQLLLSLFPEAGVYIPPTVRQELQFGLDRGKAYLLPVLQAIDAGQIQILELSTEEEQILEQLPRKLNRGE
jgi:predicted nucleic acid-binding protein